MGKSNKNTIRASVADRRFDIFNTIFMSIITLVILYPLYYALIASFTDPVVVSTGKFLLYPERLFIGGYQEIFKYKLIWSSYMNTIVYTVVGTLVSILLTVPMAYTLSRKDYAFRRPLMFLFTVTMFFQGGLIPLYLVMLKLNIINTMWAMLLPSAVSVWNLIVCRSFFDSTIPDELLDAAKIDGCNDFGFFIKMVVPLSGTILCVMIIFYATAIWNSYFPALMFMKETSMMPLQVILRNLLIVNQKVASFTDISNAAYRQLLGDQLKYSVIVVAALPLLILYPFIQKYFIKGVYVGSLKG